LQGLITRASFLTTICIVELLKDDLNTLRTFKMPQSFFEFWHIFADIFVQKYHLPEFHEIGH